MKIQFDTPLTGTDETGQIVTLTADQIAGLSYAVLLDTINPPIKKYPVPAENIAAATANADGSRHVTVDAVNDLKLTIVPGTTYYVAVEDSLGNSVSPESPALAYVDAVTPGAPTAFTVS